jgi:hypothetical protein
MPVQCCPTSSHFGATCARLRRWLLVLLWAICLPVAAQSVESVLSPGPLIKGHAKLEGECKNCHVRFDRQAQDRLCADCHKDVGRELAQRKGYHGRIKPQGQACRTCHTDHRGRDMRIAEFDKTTFDHQQLTDYPLLGKHRQVECAKCHQPQQKYNQAPHECQACHRKDDVHKGSLGNDCAKCHEEKGWRETRFDHDVTRFPLTGTHIKTKCESCHKTKDFKDTPQNCMGCHRKDDKHKGQFGEKCESCHNTWHWPQITFRHDVDTHFALRGRHREIRCISCHTGTLYREKLGSTCIECHRKDDKHKGTLGLECANCHSERSWKEGLRFQHDRTSFPLRGKHAKVECKECHKSPVFKEAPSTCIACHRKDDKHEATLGERCADCHAESDWKATPRFDHARTKFPLRGAHAAQSLRCVSCHKDLRSFRDTQMTCISCHRKDDKHEGQLGIDCAACHGEQRWAGTPFDHAKARFALSGAHLIVTCQSCHKSPRFRDAPRECGNCHQAKDVHKGSLGTACESCHNVRDWRLWRFDHSRQTEYPLVDSHAKVRCQACHTAPAPAGRKTAPLQRECFACHAKDDAHDRAYGPRCQQCHQPTRWQQIANRQFQLPQSGSLQ